MLSRSCDGCPKRFQCKIRYSQVENGFIYCDDGSRVLVDGK